MGPRVLAGRYRLDDVVGRGGMSTVYRATDLALDRIVAVKVAMDPLLERDPVYAARFKREGRAAAALSHPGAVTVFDAGSDGPTRYIVMEYVEGRSLAEILREQAPLDPGRAAHIAEQVADVLASAHALGIVHRDVKPGNIMVGANDRVKVLDFGIARTADAITLTQTASVLGTAPYMAPEQAMGQPADARSDIYSLGCVLYEMLTGQPPFMADVPAAVLHQHVRVPAKAPSALNPDAPPALDALVLQMLAKQADDRPQTAAEVRDRLGGFREGAPTEPTKPLPSVVGAVAGAAAAAADAAAAAAEVPQDATVAQAGTIPPEATAATRALPGRTPRGPRRGLWAMLAALCVLLLGAAVALALSGSANTSSSSSTSSHHGATATVTATRGAGGATTHGSSTPSTSTPSSSTTSSTASTTTTTVTTTATQPGPAGGAPPAPPGQEKKKGKKG